MKTIMNKMARTKQIAVWTPLLAAALILCGCATISENTHAYLGSPHLQPTNPASVQILALEPKQPKERLGEIVLSVEGNPSRQKLEEKLKAAAAQLGADGVFIVSDKTHIYPVTYWDCWGPATSEDWRRLIVAVAFKNQ
jgi:hypothetical protein